MPVPDPKNPPRVEEPQAAYDPAVAGVQAARQLEHSGFGSEQAEAVVLAVRDLAGDLATKEDLARLEAVTKKDLAIAKSELRVEIADLKTELKVEIADLKTELKSDIADLRAELKSELKSEISVLRAEFKTDLAQTETRMGKNSLRNTMWGVGLTVGILLAAITIATTVATTLILSALNP